MKKSVTLHYGSELNEIDANTLIVSLMSISEAVTDINRYFNSANGTDYSVNIRINAVSKGSVNFDITFVQSISAALISIFATPNSLNLIIATISDLMGIIAFLKSNKPKSVTKNANGTVTIENQFNNCKEITINTYNVYRECPKARKALAKNNEVISEDPSLTDFEILDNGVPIVTLTHEQMDAAQESPSLSQSENERSVVDTVTVKAIKISYNRNNKWSFVMGGFHINAKIEDASFWHRVDNNEMFSKGDIFNVKIRITQELDESNGAWINKNYVIEEVLDHKQPD